MKLARRSDVLVARMERDPGTRNGIVYRRIRRHDGKVKVCLAATVATFLLAFRALPEGANLVNVPVLSGAPPQVDGKISPGEWDAASGSLVALSSGGERFVTPGGQFRLGRVGNALYFLFATDSMPRMPIAKAQDQDGKVWEDDAVELFLQEGQTKLQLIVNSAGVVFDARNGDASWNGPWKVATSLVGTDFAVDESEGVKRGFVVEVMLPMDEAGLSVPSDGNRWGLQVAFDTVGNNPQAVWNPMKGLSLSESLGEMVWGGPTDRLDSIRIEDDGRLVRVGGWFGESVECAVSRVGDGSPRHLLWRGDVDESVVMAGGARYSVDITSPHLRFSFGSSARLRVPVVAVPAPSHKSFYVAYDASKIPVENRFPLKLGLVQGDKTLYSGELDVRGAIGRKVVWIGYRGWETGPCQLIVHEMRPNQAPVECGRIPLRVPEVPEWAGARLPECTAVPEPFAAVQVSRNSAKVYGRKYYFGKSLFLDQVNSAGGDILASAVTLRGQLDGKPLAWQVQSWKVESKSPDKVVYRGVASAGALRVEVKTTLEFDGMVRFDWRLEPLGGPKTVNDLNLVVPVKRDVARSFMQYRPQGRTFNDQDMWNRSGDLTDEGWSCAFTPFFWLGNQTRGIQWFAESRAGWTPADENKIIEVRCEGKSATLILHLSDGKRTFDRPIDFTFGLMASPIRPRPSASDLAGSRIMVLTSPEQMTGIGSLKSGILIPLAREDMRPSGCFEMDFRVDWDPEHPADKERTISLYSHGNSMGQQLHLNWLAPNKSLRITHVTPEAGQQTIGEATVALSKGQWYRLAFNYGEQMQVYLDGKLVLSAPDDRPMPAFDYWAGDTIGGSGRIALRGWRISQSPRRTEEVQPGIEWRADENTRHLELLESDPTPMNLTNPCVASTASPGYLSGNWSYDAKNRWLIAGPDGPEMSGAENAARTGVRGVVFFDWSKHRLGNGGPAHPEVFAKCLELCNNHGIRVLPYTSWCIQNVEPEFEDYKWELSNTGPEIEPTAGWREFGESSYQSCPASIGGKRNLWQIDQFMRLGAGGVYLDGIVYPRECSNPMHGHDPVVDPVTGKPVVVTRIFDQREYIRRMYCIIKSHRKDALMDAHTSNGYTLPTMSFVTNATNGEALGLHSDWYRYVEPEVIRAEFHARQYGFNSDALFYNNSPVPVEYGMTIMGIHGQTPRLMWGMYAARAAKVWELADRFDTNTAKWVPYYYPEKSPFKAIDHRVLVSAFVHYGKRALLLATNWSDAPCSSEIRIDWKALGLPATTPVKVVNTNTQLEVRDGAITLPLRQRWLTYIWIGK